MGVYIKGLDMPRCCRVCPFSHIWEYDDETSCILGGCWHARSSNKRHKDCPLVEVKEPHGDLIDRDELIRKARVIHSYDGDGFEFECMGVLDGTLVDAPTVIEAEG